jgi:hypothetical protein
MRHRSASARRSKERKCNGEDGLAKEHEERETEIMKKGKKRDRPNCIDELEEVAAFLIRHKEGFNVSSFSQLLFMGQRLLENIRQ